MSSYDAANSRQPGSSKREGPIQDGSEPGAKKKRTSAYDVNFEIVMAENGVYGPDYQFHNGRSLPTPKNLKNVKEALSARRNSLSSEDVFEPMFRTFKRHGEGQTESTWKQVSLGILTGNELGYNTCCDAMLSNLNSLLKADALVRPVPDRYDGANPMSVDADIRRQLDKLIVPVRDNCQSVAPNFFFEMKRPDGNFRVLKRQAMHDGAIGARAMHSLRNYHQTGQQFDDMAYTISATYQDGFLRIYVHHVIAGVKEGLPEYFMTRIFSRDITEPEFFSSEVLALRNARDWAKSTRDRLISEANRRVGLGATQNPVIISSAEGNNQDSDAD